MNRLLAIALLLSPITAFGQEDPRLVIVSPLRAIGVADAELNLGVKQGDGQGAGNASAINDKIKSRDVRYPILFRGGNYDIEDTIGAGVNRTGWNLIGSGVGQENAVADSFWTSPSQDGGGQGVRLNWNLRTITDVYPLDRVLIRTDAASVLLDRLDLRGTSRISAGSSGAPRLAKLGEPTMWSATSIDTGSITINAGSSSARTYTRTSGSYIADGFTVGDYVTFSGFSVSANNGTKQISALTATVLTVTAATAGNMQAETGNANEQAIWAYAPNSFVMDGGQVWRASPSGTSGVLEPGDSGWAQAGYRAHIGVWHQSADWPIWDDEANYAQHAVVSHNGAVWVATNGNPAVGDEPGVDSDWVQAGPQYRAVDKQNGPLVMSSMSFGDMDIGIFAGPHTEPGITVNGVGLADENTSYGDTMQGGYLQFHRVPTCVWIRTIQSVSNQFKQLYGRVAVAEDFKDTTKGGNAVLWAEFAGETVVDNIQCGNYRTAARVGYLPGGPVTVRSFRFDGGSITHGRLLDVDDFAYGSGHGGGQNRVTIENGTFIGVGNITNAMDAVSGNPIGTWDTDASYAINTIIYHDGAAWKANEATTASDAAPGTSSKWDSYTTWFREPIVHWGPGLLTLRNVNGLGGPATKIRLSGVTTEGNPPRWASVVILENSFFSSIIAHPSEIIDLDTSDGPYMVVWRNCGRRFGSVQNNRIEMFRDGHFISPGHESMLLDADSTPAPPPWDLPD